MRRGGRLAWLLAVHAAASASLGGYGIVAGRPTGPPSWRLLPILAMLALAFGQGCLLGVWAAFSGASWWLRLVGLAAGAGCLEALVAASIHDNDFLLMPSMAAGLIAAVLSVVRLRRADLRPPDAAGQGAAGEGIRFTIRGLMLFTLAVGLLIGGARGARQAFGRLGPSLLVAGVWSLSFVVLALAACWAALGVARPGPRVAGVVLCAAALGALFAYGIGQDREWISIAAFTGVTAGQSAIVLGSLLLVRGAGYRLVGRSTPPRESPSELAVPAEVAD